MIFDQHASDQLNLAKNKLEMHFHKVCRRTAVDGRSAELRRVRENDFPK